MMSRNATSRWPLPWPVIATFLLVSCVVRATPAKAAIIHDNGAPSDSGAFLSDDDSGFRFADDFQLASPDLVNAVRFWGVYSPADTPTQPDDFSVIFYGDDAGLPDGTNVIAAFSIGDPGRIDTGNVLNSGATIYEYVATFSDLILPAGDYWLSIFNDTTADGDDNWAWVRHTFPGNDARSLDLGATWLHEFSDSELAFQLLALPSSPIPEPSTLSIWSCIAIWLLPRRLNGRGGRRKTFANGCPAEVPARHESVATDHRAP